MKASLLTATTLAFSFAATAVSFGQDSPEPPLVKQISHGNWLPQAEAEALRDELYYDQTWKSDDVVNLK